MVGKVVYNLLSNDGPIQAVIGSAIYPIVAPQTVEGTFIVYNEIDFNSWITKDKPYPTRKHTVQVDVYSQSASTLFSVSELVETALNYQNGEIAGQCVFMIIYEGANDNYNGEDETYRRTLSFSVIINN